VLVVDDEADIRELLALTVQRMGLDADTAANEFAAVQLLQKHRYDVCLTDMRLPDGDGLSLLAHATRLYPQMPVAVITAYGSTENAVAALKAGAFDYLSKPVSLEQLRTLVQSALKLADGTPRKARGNAPLPARELLGTSERVVRVREMIEKVARSQAPVHITGESGSGKELAARLIHEKSVRRDHPFVPVNCGAIPENLMESEFFGYRRGAFTGADQDRDGFFQAAHRGTLFLDEVAELPLPMQVKLLRVIQEKAVRKVGATDEERVDVRIISATHQNLADEVLASNFRQDLYYRLNVIDVKMPSLREMPEDIPLLATNVLAISAAAAGVTPPRLHRDALDALRQYRFPGNVRELENILERAIALIAGDEIGVDDLQLAGQDDLRRLGNQDLQHLRSTLPLQEYLEALEKEAILEALEKTRHNRTAAAKLLGITFRALRYRMDRLGIE
jgi:two-component system response regulator PilR (NtrC family)